jgi:membrane peptidoglycan carboxypeptidase
MLAGMVQRPSYYNPFRYPDRVQERRNRGAAPDAREQDF